MILEELDYLNMFRYPSNEDDVKVILVKEGNDPEPCRVHLEDKDGDYILGRLAYDPLQEFGYHEGERIAFFLFTDSEGNQVLISNMNPSMKLTPEDLADGSMLRDAIKVFNNDRTQKNFIDVLELLRDSLVWIPCNVVMGQADQNYFEELAHKDSEEVAGQTVTIQEDMRFIPDILMNGDKYYFPVFTGMDEMGDYGNGFSKVQKHFLEAISLARGNEADVAGIVIDAFSEPIVIDKGLFDIIWDLKSRL